MWTYNDAALPIGNTPLKTMKCVKLFHSLIYSKIKEEFQQYDSLNIFSRTWPDLKKKKFGPFQTTLKYLTHI